MADRAIDQKGAKSPKAGLLGQPESPALLSIMTPHAVVQMQRTIGNRAMTQLLQRKVATGIVNQVATPMDGVTSLSAIIGADDLWARGSKAQKGQPTRIKHVGSPIKTRYVGGHMLNQDVGGDGTWDNMIVQSHTSNTNMNLHDNIIKRLGTRARQLEDGGTALEKQHEYWVEEDITVNPPAPGAYNFPGEQHVPASLDVTLTPRKEHKTSGVVSPWTGHGETINNPYHVVNVPPYPPRPGVAARYVNQAERRRRRERRFKRLYSGTDAHTLRARHFKRVIGIGPTAATALETFFQTYAIDLQTLYRRMAKPNYQGVYTGQGFNRRHVALLIYAGLV